MEAAKLVLDAVGLEADYQEGDIGWEFWKNEGDPLPARTIELLKETDVCLLGAITSKPIEEAKLELKPQLKNKGVSYYSPIIRLRQEFKLHTNIRPCKSYKGNPLNYKEGIDIVVFRENTEGLYSGVEFYPMPSNLKEWLLQNHPRMKKFEYAKNKNYKTVTIVEKPNVLRETGGLILREARTITKNYPEIRLFENNIDAICMWLLKNPLDYSVLVAENLFGDIISDLCAQLVGGLGFAPSGNIGNEYALFEPTHGSAPKYASQYKVNPIAMILSVKMLLDYVGETDLSLRVEQAVESVIMEGHVRTYDMGGNSSTLEMAHAIANRL